MIKCILYDLFIVILSFDQYIKSFVHHRRKVIIIQIFFYININSKMFLFITLIKYKFK